MNEVYLHCYDFMIDSASDILRGRTKGRGRYKLLKNYYIALSRQFTSKTWLMRTFFPLLRSLIRCSCVASELSILSMIDFISRDKKNLLT